MVYVFIFCPKCELANHHQIASMSSIRSKIKNTHIQYLFSCKLAKKLIKQINGIIRSLDWPLAFPVDFSV